MNLEKEFEYSKHLYEGKKHYAQSDYEKAYDEYFKATEIFPHRPEALECLVKILSESPNDENNSRSLMDFYERMLEADPYNESNYEVYNNISINSERRAFELYRLLFGKYPENAELGRAFFQRYEKWHCDEYPFASPMLDEEILSILPKNPQQCIGQVLYCMSRGKYGKTYTSNPQELLEEAVELDQNYAPAHLWKGIIGKDDERFEHLQKYYELTGDSSVQIFLGNEYFKKQEYTLALDYYKNAPFEKMEKYTELVFIRYNELACAEAYENMEIMQREKKTRLCLDGLMRCCAKHAGNNLLWGDY